MDSGVSNLFHVSRDVSKSLFARPMALEAEDAWTVDQECTTFTMRLCVVYLELLEASICDVRLWTMLFQTLIWPEVVETVTS